MFIFAFLNFWVFEKKKKKKNKFSILKNPLIKVLFVAKKSHKLLPFQKRYFQVQWKVGTPCPTGKRQPILKINEKQISKKKKYINVAFKFQLRYVL